MGFIFIVILVIVVLNILLPSPNVSINPSVKKICPLHKYEYNVNDVMVCTICKKTPEQIISG